MKMKTILLIMFVMIGILPHTAAATPGIYVTVDSLSQPAFSGNTIDYVVTISNMDDGIPKHITGLEITMTQPGWTYTFDPDIVGQDIPAGNGESKSTVLSVTSPAGTTIGFYEHQINAVVEYTVPWFPFPATEFDPENFNTDIQGSTSVPEFSTIALPVLSVIGLMLVFGRRRENS